MAGSAVMERLAGAWRDATLKGTMRVLFTSSAKVYCCIAKQ